MPDYKPMRRPSSSVPSSCFPKASRNSLRRTLSRVRFPNTTSRSNRRSRISLHPNVGSNPAAKIFNSDLDKLGTAAEFPYVGTTYRLTEHFHYWTKNIAGPAQLQPHFFVEMPEALATREGNSKR